MIVSNGCVGLSPVLGIWPAAIRAIIVSPIPRETPRTIAATIPERAAGKTTRVEVWSFDAPMPNAPSRRLPGTADIASSEIEATVGTIMIPITSPAPRGVEDLHVESEEVVEDASG